MLPAKYYQYIYLLIITVITYFICNYSSKHRGKENLFPSLLLCLLLILVIGYRPIDRAFADTMSYAENWQFFYKEPFEFNFNAENLLFDNLFAYIGSLGLNISVFFVIISAIYFGSILIACRKLFPNNTLLAFVVYLGALSTFSYGTNGIKAGAAASLFLLALAYYDKLYLSIILVLLSWGFHHSMQLPFAAYIITLFFKNQKIYFAIWFICLLISAAHITFFQTLFAGLTDESGAKYLTSDEFGTVKGFRFDFIIYSAMPILMGYYVKYKYHFSGKFYETILNIYILSNSIWMLSMYAAFTNRIAYLSWFMYPFLIIYPSLRIKDQKHPLVVNRNKFIGLHLGFTLFMFFIYYI